MALKTNLGNAAFLAATAATLLVTEANAFELGATDADIYAAKGHEALAGELSGYLTKVFGKAFTVNPMPAEGADAPAGIFVGAKPPDCDVTWDESRECCVRIVEPARVWLFGNDSRKGLQGTADAVYDFLERYAGVRWLWPGEVGTVADPSEPVSLKEEKTVFVPPFRVRLTNSFTYPSGHSPAEGRDLSAWLRHRHVGKSINSIGSGFQHAFGSLLPRDKYGEEHPEYYSLVSPERWVGEPKPTEPTRLSGKFMPGPWQLCTSNPEVRRLIAEKLVAKKTDAIQSISPNDGLGFCECEACRAQDPEGQGIVGRSYDITDRMYDFLSDIAWQVYKASPTSKVGLFSYSCYSHAPKKKFELPPNVYLSCCYGVYNIDSKMEAALNEKLAGLAATGAQIIGREYWGTHYMMRCPVSQSRKIDRNLKLLHKLGAAGIYGETGNDFAVRASDLYLLTRLAWDPEVDRVAELRDFCQKGFGPAAETMFNLFEAIEDRVEKKIEDYGQYQDKVFDQFNRRGYAGFNHYMTTIFDKDFAAMCDRETKKALKLADTPERKRRVEYIASGLAFAKIVTDALRGFADLADIGNDVSLTLPSCEDIKMEKGELLKVVGRAIAAENARKRYSQMYHGSNALTTDTRSQALDLRPWGAMAERARLLLISDRYNYLVNGAFEYRGFSWEVTGDGTNVYTTARNHDADDNWMVQCHQGQGVSLELTVAPGGEMKVRNLRKVSPATPVSARLKLFARCGDDPLSHISVSFGGVELKGVDIGRELPDDDGWHELRFHPADLPAGDHEFVVTVRNLGTEPLVVNLDDLNLRLKP